MRLTFSVSRRTSKIDLARKGPKATQEKNTNFMIVLRLQKYISVMSGHVRKLGERSPPCPQPKQMFFLRCRMFCNGNIYILLKNFAKYIDLGLFVGWRECLTWDSWKGFVFFKFLLKSYVLEHSEYFDTHIGNYEEKN